MSNHFLHQFDIENVQSRKKKNYINIALVKNQFFTTLLKIYSSRSIFFYIVVLRSRNFLRFLSKLNFHRVAAEIV